MMQSVPELAVVVPVLNEAAYIEDCLASLLPQAERANAIVLVMDGGSTDGTQAMVRGLAEHHPSLELHENPKRLQSAAMNLAAAIAPAYVKFLLRADAHATYPPDFIARCMEARQAQAATAVVVPMRTVGRTPMQRAIAAAQNSRIGNGGSAHRVGATSGSVDHGHHALFDRAFFQRLGGYNENFSHNEDAEFDVRAVAAGGKIWMCAEAPVTYFPRRSLGRLARQYFQHGRGRAKTMRLHALQPRPRQLAAPAIVLLCIASIILLPFSAWFAVFPAFYIALCCAAAILTAFRARDAWLLGMAPAVVVIHFSWAAGALRGIVQKPHAAGAQSEPAALNSAPNMERSLGGA